MILKSLEEVLLCLTILYLEKGCGPWMGLACWNAAFSLFHLPNGIVSGIMDQFHQEFDPMKPIFGIDINDKNKEQGGPAPSYGELKQALEVVANAPQEPDA